MSGAGGARAYVSGAGRGIGRAVALALAERGADVAIGYVRREDTARAAAEQIAALGRRAVLVRGDVGDDPAAVNAVAPGPTATEAFDAMAAGDAAALRERFASITPMGRMGEPADAARLVASLCSPEAGWVTGQLIFSDGGYALV
ncbi:MAG TPA: SDR family oxidoreductase [Solirubrobacteraceae bacterium]|nr:SDR family oxidoreductase [Solirubrobacteraceae bacterium]